MTQCRNVVIEMVHTSFALIYVLNELLIYM